jgi:signal transduction histidine kinase
MKKQLEDHRVAVSEVVAWHAEMANLMAQVKSHIDAEVKNSLDMLHDVQTACSSIIRNAEEFVEGLKGSSLEEKLEKLKPAELALIKSTQLLEARLNLMSLLSNPAAAKYGKKVSVPVYRAVDKLVRILRASAAKRELDLTISGGATKTPRLYPSFETIPMVLIENAIKYTQEKGEVAVVVEDVERGVRLTVKSVSPRIPQEDRAKVFKRGFRSANAVAVASQGSGLGLYTASIVADAHGTAIYHSESEAVSHVNGIDYCENEFHVTFF